MQRIILHHTGGSHKPNSVDILHYHFIVDGDGKVHTGKFPVSANAPGKSLKSGTYAAHTSMLNTGSIGISAASMSGNPPWNNPFASPHFPTLQQMESMLEFVATLSEQYGIPVTRKTILSHAEVEITLGVRQAGKWDFDYDPFGVLATRDPIAIGDMLRARVQSYLGDKVVQKPPMVLPLLKRGMRGEYVMALQKYLISAGINVSADGIFGPQTWNAVVNFQTKSQLIPDGIVGENTWGALIAQAGE